MASEITGDNASVEVALIHNPSDPFSTGYRDMQRAILVKQQWGLEEYPPCLKYYFWDYNWYQELPK